MNLNGRWRFAFDPRNQGEGAGWTSGSLPQGREILVPFSWGAPLSGVPDSADIGWYARSIHHLSHMPLLVIFGTNTFVNIIYPKGGAPEAGGHGPAAKASSRSSRAPTERSCCGTSEPRGCPRDARGRPSRRCWRTSCAPRAPRRWDRPGTCSGTCPGRTSRPTWSRSRCRTRPEPAVWSALSRAK